MNQTVVLATLLALVTCFVAVLVAVSLNHDLVNQTNALGVGVVLGGLLGFLSSNGNPPSSPLPPKE